MASSALTNYFLVAVAAFFLTVGGLWLLLRTGLAHRLALDIPNNRSLHSVPIPRVGGFVIVPVALAVTWVAVGVYPVLILATLILWLLSFLDDRLNLPVALRLGLHLVVASWLVTRNVHLPEGLLLAVFSVLAIGWLANLYNFMDGVDGLAGGMALIGFFSLGMASFAHTPNLAVLSFSIAAAAGGFLFFNFPPARIFLGDSGSIPLGFLAAAIAAEGWRTNIWPFWFPVLVFSPFVVDATFTLLKRLVRGEHFWRAHRDHYYQRLVRMGWSHKRTAVAEYALMGLASLLGIVALDFSAEWQWVVVGLWFMLLLTLMALVDRSWRRWSRDVS
jgi:UDP-N-acetylmuramyl pentapeptide phosphotransferase/UDP-N-acetylglucosamine-1-phosphate transferase